MTTETTNYLREAADDAADTVRNFADEILEQLLDDGKASDDLLNDYPNGDAWHHESHVDKWYSMIDAATLIDQLDEFEETDSGLWEGQPQGGHRHLRGLHLRQCRHVGMARTDREDQ